LFDRFLDAEPALKRTATRRRVVFIGSLGAHALAVAGLIIWSFITVEEVEPPPLTVSFFSAPPPPPPPPPPPGGAKKSEPKPKKDPIKKPDQLVQPTEVKPIPEPTEAESDEPEVEGGQVGGQVGGVAGGVVGGVVGGVIGGQVDSPAPAKPKNVPPHVLKGEKLSGDNPASPANIKNLHRGKKVTINVLICIDQQGNVDRGATRILSGLPGFADFVLPAILQWKFKPQPIPICGPYIFNFSYID